ncbi:YlxR family protein [Candidatus Peregrinibacteria bacterium]|nr:YlxR family protein [Candidatus Peregrinibacteria bacterium]
MSKKRNIERMCIITRKILPKDQLFRIAATKDGKILLDEDGKTLGRGMYVQKNLEIIKNLFSEKKRGLWNWALKREPSAEEREEILRKILRSA